MSQSISIRDLRTQLAAVLRKVSRGEHFVITRQGKPVARIIPEPGQTLEQSRKHPLRGSVRRMAKDFDRPLEDLWEALKP